MWVFLNNAMVSIVAHRTKPRHLLVRARIRGDIDRMFPRAQVSRTPGADYAYRVTVTRNAVAKVMADQVLGIDYANFKGSIPSQDVVRRDAYGEVWSVMLDAQARLEPDTAQGVL